jgi:hypothetical protein
MHTHNTTTTTIKIPSRNRVNWPRDKKKKANIAYVSRKECLARYMKLHKSKKRVYFTKGAPGGKPERRASWNCNKCVYFLHRRTSGGGYPQMSIWQPGL